MEHTLLYVRLMAGMQGASPFNSPNSTTRQKEGIISFCPFLFGFPELDLASHTNCPKMLVYSSQSSPGDRTVASTSHLGRAPKLDMPIPPPPASELSTHCLVGVTPHLLTNTTIFLISISYPHLLAAASATTKSGKDPVLSARLKNRSKLGKAGRTLSVCFEFF